MRIVCCLVLFGACAWATAAEETAARAHYIANKGAMIERGDTRVLFDPLFRNDFDIYQPVPVAVSPGSKSGRTKGSTRSAGRLFN